LTGVWRYNIFLGAEGTVEVCVRGARASFTVLSSLVHIHLNIPRPSTFSQLIYPQSQIIAKWALFLMTCLCVDLFRPQEGWGGGG
jgi:hypothetical protein